MRPIATAVAALALMAGAGHLEAKGNGGGGNGHGPGASMQGGGHGNGHDAGSSMQGGQGGGRAESSSMRAAGGNGNADRGNGGGNKDRGVARSPESGSGAARAERGNSGEHAGRADAGRMAADIRRRDDNRGNGNDHDVRGRDHDNRLVVLDERGRGDGDVVRVRNFAALPARGVVTGCPPGLAKKNPPCVPPGQVRTAFRGFDRPGFWGLRLDDGRYRYDDGYLVRLAPDGRIGGYVPLLGGALAVGNLWPASYEPVALPTYYESYYGLGPYDSYRYADNVIYQVDPETAAITSVIALLTGDTFAVGQPMPTGYDVYNVPYAYRDRYYDTPDALYRYSDGYVYQVDPETRLVQAAIELLAS